MHKTQNPLDNIALSACQNWVEKVIIAHNFCPFAKRERDRDSIRYILSPYTTLEHCLQFFADELLYLEDNHSVETSLLVFANGFEDFDQYLELLELSQDVLESIGFSEKFQLASFHPDYCFEGCKEDDVENYSNRSPFPMLHLLREKTVTQVLANYPSPEEIPLRNIAYAKALGLETMKRLLKSSYPETG